MRTLKEFARSRNVYAWLEGAQPRRGEWYVRADWVPHDEGAPSRCRLSFSSEWSVCFNAKFDDDAIPAAPCMDHCHMANHDGGGFMGQTLVE